MNEGGGICISKTDIESLEHSVQYSTGKDDILRARIALTLTSGFVLRESIVKRGAFEGWGPKLELG
jgi:hypothetical protein